MSNYRFELAKLYQRQGLLFILIFSLVTIAVWIVITLVLAQGRPQITPQQQRLATPLTPNLDEAILQQLTTRQTNIPDDVNDFPIYVIYIDDNAETRRLLTIEQVNTLEAQASQTPQPAPSQPSEQSATEPPTTPDSIDSTQPDQPPQSELGTL